MRRLTGAIRFWMSVGPFMALGFAPMAVGLGFAWASLPTSQAMVTTLIPAANALCFVVFGRINADPRGGGWRRYWQRQLAEGDSPGGLKFIVVFIALFWSVIGILIAAETMKKRESLARQLDIEDARRLQRERQQNDPFPERQGATG